MKIKTTSGKSVFCCFRTSRGGKSLPIRSRQRLCVCCLCFSPGVRPQARVCLPGGCSGSGVLGRGSGAAVRERSPRPPQLPAHAAAFSPLPACERTLDNKHGCRTARASGSEAFGDYFGQERGGVYRVRSCGRNPPAAVPRQQGRGSVERNRRAHRKVPQAGGTEPVRPERRRQHRRGGQGRGRAGWRVGQPRREDLKRPVGRDGFKGCFAVSGLGDARPRRAGCGGPTERGARGRARARGRAPLGAVGAGAAHAPRCVTCGGSGGAGRPPGPPRARGAWPGAPALGPTTLLRAEGGDRAPSLLGAAGAGFLSGEAPGRSPGHRLGRAAPGSAEAAGAPDVRSGTRACRSPFAAPAALIPSGSLLGPATRGCVVAGRGQATQNHKRTNKQPPTHPLEKLGSGLMPGPGFTPSLTFMQLGCNASASYFARWTKQLVRAFEV